VEGGHWSALLPAVDEGPGRVRVVGRKEDLKSVSEGDAEEEDGMLFTE
jgi:hypothetical protein